MPVGKLWELAAIADMPSAPTLRALIRERADFPVITRGRKGAEYLLDLDAAAAFVRANWRDGRAELSGRARATRSRNGRNAGQASLPGLFDGDHPARLS